MADRSPVRDPVIHEKLQQFIGAVRMLLTMVGAEQLEDSWIQQTAALIPPNDIPKAKEVFTVAVKYVYDVTTKFTLIFKGAKKPEDVGTYADTMEQALVGLVQTSQVMLNVIKAHPLLRKQINTLVNDILGVSIRLATEMCEKIDSSVTSRLTGMIWSDCDALEAIHLETNLKSFVDTTIKAQLRSLKDALEELEENKNEEVDDEIEEDDEEEDEDDFTMSAEDKKILPGCILLIKTANSFCVQISKVTNMINESIDQEKTEKSLLALNDQMLKIGASVDNIISSVYPPQNITEIITASSELKNLFASIADLIAEIPQLEPQAPKLKALINAANGFIEKAETQIKDP